MSYDTCNHDHMVRVRIEQRERLMAGRMSAMHLEKEKKHSKFADIFTKHAIETLAQERLDGFPCFSHFSSLFTQASFVAARS